MLVKAGTNTTYQEKDVGRNANGDNVRVPACVSLFSSHRVYDLCFMMPVIHDHHIVPKQCVYKHLRVSGAYQSLKLIKLSSIR